MNRLSLVEIRNNIAESPVILAEQVASLVTILNNCIESHEAGTLMSNDNQLYKIAFDVVESVKSAIGNELNDVTHTVWNMLCWLRESMTRMMYLTFDVSDIIQHDLSVVPINQIMPLIKSKMSDLFDEGGLYHKHAIRYLSVLNEILIEKGVS